MNTADAASVYSLGMFSGAATSCCAPVLAGILILTAMSASVADGLLIGFTYVIGMVFPLFVIALLWDRYRAEGDSPLSGKILSPRIFGRGFSIHSSKLVSGLIFLVMGVVNILVGLTGIMIPAPGSIAVGEIQAGLQKNLLTTFSTLSLEPAILFRLIAIACAIILGIMIRFSRGRNTGDSTSSD